MTKEYFAQSIGKSTRWLSDHITGPERGYPQRTPIEVLIQAVEDLAASGDAFNGTSEWETYKIMRGPARRLVEAIAKVNADKSDPRVIVRRKPTRVAEGNHRVWIVDLLKMKNSSLAWKSKHIVDVLDGIHEFPILEPDEQRIFEEALGMPHGALNAEPVASPALGSKETVERALIDRLVQEKVRAPGRNLREPDLLERSHAHLTKAVPKEIWGAIGADVQKAIARAIAPLVQSDLSVKAASRRTTVQCGGRFPGAVIRQVAARLPRIEEGLRPAAARLRPPMSIPQNGDYVGGLAGAIGVDALELSLLLLGLAGKRHFNETAAALRAYKAPQWNSSNFCYRIVGLTLAPGREPLARPPATDG